MESSSWENKKTENFIGRILAGTSWKVRRRLREEAIDNIKI
jgi:hypothetical protein